MTNAEIVAEFRALEAAVPAAPTQGERDAAIVRQHQLIETLTRREDAGDADATACFARLFAQ